MIAAAVEEQSKTAEDIAKNIGKTSDIAIDIEKMSEDVMNEIAAMAKITEELNISTAGFRTKGIDYI